MKSSDQYHSMRVVPIRYKPEYHSFELEILCLTKNTNGAFLAQIYSQNSCDLGSSPSKLETDCSRIFFDGTGNRDELNVQLHERIKQLLTYPTEEQLWTSFYESRLELAATKARYYAESKVHTFILPDVVRTWAIISAYVKTLQIPSP